MEDVRGLIHQTQDEVVILGALVSGAESSNPGNQAPAHHHQVTRVVGAQEVVGRPVGLEEHIAASAGRIELVLIRIEKVGFRMLVQARHDLEQCVGSHFVVVIEKRHELAVGQRQSGVQGSGDAGVGRQRQHLDPHISRMLSKHVQSVRRSSIHRPPDRAASWDMPGFSQTRYKRGAIARPCCTRG